MKFQLKPCTEKQLPEILDIFNDAILNSTALYDYKTRDMAMMQAWYADKLKGNYPIVGAFDHDDTLLGFATYGLFRVRPAYKYTVEHSVYVRSDKRGEGIGKVLLREIVKKAAEQDYHVLVAGIDAANTVSKQLHEKEGFEFCGLIKQSGYKFGKWLDLAFYQLILKTPETPVEG
ncbi:MAG: N-acetyltransferase family protein [Bacteroidota bacterium]|nr:N-acetyltransferase family protein [Bacteroidota bacterium]